MGELCNCLEWGPGHDGSTYLHDALDVAMTLGKVDGTELGGSLSVLVVALEDRSSTFSLGSDNSSHGG